ncbi:MAG: hypothetical protein ABIG44_03270 [Planctomycetota bacterium]
MIDMEENNRPIVINKTRAVAVALAIGGALLAAVTLIWAIARYAELSHAEKFSVAGFFQTTALLFGGAALGLLLWGTAEVLRRLDSLLEVLRDSRSSVSGDSTVYGLPVHAPATLEAPNEMISAMKELVRLTHEVRDIALLSEPERAARLQAQGQTLVRQLQQRIPALLNEHKWVDARRLVQHARERFPNFSEWTELEKRIEAMRTSVEARDTENTARQISDLIALEAWDRAMSVLHELQERHPNSTKVQELVRRTTIQHEKANAEQRARLMAQAQEAVNTKDYNRALGLANTLIRQYSGSSEAEALRQQMPTLTENAQIQARQQMETEYRELTKSHQYNEALILAREMIERYPNSPQAEALRAQLPRLEARAATAR